MQSSILCRITSEMLDYLFVLVVVHQSPTSEQFNMTKKRIRNRKDKQEEEKQMVKVGQNILNLKRMQQLETLLQYLTF